MAALRAHLRPPGLGDEGGVNGHGKGCPVHPHALSASTDSTVPSIHHIRCRDAVDGGTLSIVQQHAAVLQMSRQGHPVSAENRSDSAPASPDDLLLQVIAVGRIGRSTPGYTSR